MTVGLRCEGHSGIVFFFLCHFLSCMLWVVILLEDLWTAYKTAFWYWVGSLGNLQTSLCSAKIKDSSCQTKHGHTKTKPSPPHVYSLHSVPYFGSWFFFSFHLQFLTKKAPILSHESKDFSPRAFVTSISCQVFFVCFSVNGEALLGFLHWSPLWFIM